MKDDLMNRRGVLRWKEIHAYEGGFLNGEKHGKGTITVYNEFDNKIFESEYINGISNGPGKEYDFQGEIIFLGEYSNGQKNGKGKEYYDGNLIFEGEYLNDERNGKGKKYYESANLI
jgi:antitoxin component YwqK of YwqJK toxin-antitoxin module